MKAATGHGWKWCWWEWSRGLENQNNELKEAKTVWIWGEVRICVIILCRLVSSSNTLSFYPLLMKVKLKIKWSVLLETRKHTVVKKWRDWHDGTAWHRRGGTLRKGGYEHYSADCRGWFNGGMTFSHTPHPNTACRSHPQLELLGHPNQ